MTDHSEYFNPDLEAILQEIARDPRAKMLKVPSSGALIYASKQSPIGVAAPSLTSAEVELLTIHREELADRLKERCLIEFFRAPGADEKLHRCVELGRTLEVRDLNDWECETQELLELKFEGERESLAADVLQKCIQVDEGRPVSVIQIATAMMRVAHREQGRCYVAMDLRDQGMHIEAIRCLQGLISDAPSNLITSYAWDTMAISHWRLGDLPSALAASKNAVESCELRINPLASLIELAVCSRDLNAVERACHKLDDFVFEDDSCNSWFLKNKRKSSNTHSLDQDTLNKTRKFMDVVGPFSRRLLDAILS